MRHFYAISPNEIAIAGLRPDSSDRFERPNATRLESGTLIFAVK